MLKRLTPLTLYIAALALIIGSCIAIARLRAEPTTAQVDQLCTSEIPEEVRSYAYGIRSSGAKHAHAMHDHLIAYADALVRHGVMPELPESLSLDEMSTLNAQRSYVKMSIHSCNGETR